MFLRLILAAFHGLVSSKYNSVLPELVTCNLPFVFVVPMLIFPPLKYEFPEPAICTFVSLVSFTKSSLALPLSVSSIVYGVPSFLWRVRAEFSVIPLIESCQRLFIVNAAVPFALTTKAESLVPAVQPVLLNSV